MVFFGSVCGVFGNRGQVDYAAANDALDGLARIANVQRVGRVVSVDWGPWEGAGMVSAELEREYARRGIGLIELADGVRALLDELRAGPDGPAQAVVMRAHHGSPFASLRPPRRPRDRSRGARGRHRRDGCVFPGAPDPARSGRTSSGADAISEVPAARWDPVYFDPASTSPDRFYCNRGGFVDAFATFDPTGFGIMPVAAAGAEPDQLLALATAAAALDDAGSPQDRLAPERIGVIIGRGGYLTPGVARLAQRIRTAQQLVETLRALLPEISADRLEQVRAEFQAQLGPVRPESSIGLVPNLAASRIANRLDLRGPAYTVDAACASSLVAVDQAVASSPPGAATWWSPAACTSATTSRSGACSRSSARCRRRARSGRSTGAPTASSSARARACSCSSASPTPSATTTASTPSSAARAWPATAAPRA